MKTLLFIMLTSMSLTTIQAAVECTTEPMTKWKDQVTFQKELEKSYKIKEFKVTPGNCYEIYGWDKKGNKVEIYFNPVTGEIVKKRG